MPLNPFFLQGSASEQRLVQDLINEQLRMYGIEVYYLPREIISRKTVFQEVQSSEFDDNYLIEAYVNTYDGTFHNQIERHNRIKPVSYTHLTLPTSR